MNYKLLFQLEAEQNREYEIEIKNQHSKIRAYKNLVLSKNEEIEELKKELYLAHKELGIKDRTISEVNRCIDEFRKIVYKNTLDIKA